MESEGVHGPQSVDAASRSWLYGVLDDFLSEQRRMHSSMAPHQTRPGFQSVPLPAAPSGESTRPQLRAEECESSLLSLASSLSTLREAVLLEVRPEIAELASRLERIEAICGDKGSEVSGEACISPAEVRRATETTCVSSAAAERPTNSTVPVDDGDSVPLEASIWTAPLLIGRRVAGPGGSILLCCLLLLNVLVQGLFLCITIENLSKPSIVHDTVTELHAWRRSVAHNVEDYNELSHKSLTARVCDGDAGLETSANQKTLYENLHDYLKTWNGDGDGKGGTGVWMCSLALVVWTLTIVKELNAIHASVAAVWAVPRCDESRLIADGQLKISQLSRVRALFFFSTAALRLTICLGLLYYGAKFLIVTVSVSELLLNCVALEFITGALFNT